MVASYTYYKKCTCDIGTRSDYKTGCQIHDPKMRLVTKYIDISELESKCDALKAALSEIATFDKWSHAPGQCPMGCNAPEVAKKALGIEISAGWEKLPDEIEELIKIKSKLMQEGDGK